MIKEVTAWHDKHLKPVLVTEYGAGALAGLHTVFERQSLLGHYQKIKYLNPINI
jgi:hypothetical protein